MSTIGPNVRFLAKRLEQDILRRGLRAGDRYLTSVEAAKFLDVSTGTAHQAMRLLAERDIVDRRRKRGTFVGGAMEQPVSSQRKRVHVIITSAVHGDPALSFISEEFVARVSEAMGSAAVQIEFAPPGDGVAFVRRLVDETEARGDSGGFILSRSTYQMQRFLQDQHLPAVVKGHVYPGITALPWIDEDQHRIGRLTAEYVLKAGHRRLAVLMYDNWAPGDNLFISGLMEVMQASGPKVQRLEICSLPPYELPISHRLGELLSAADRPTVLINRSPRDAKVAFDVARSLGLDVPKDLELVMGNVTYGAVLPQPVPHAVGGMDARQEGRVVGRMLSELQAGRRPDPDHYISPVKFRQR